MAEIVYTARERSRLDLISDKLISDAKSEGLTLTREQVEYLPSVRLFVLSEHDAGGALEEAKRLPELQAQLRARALSDALNDSSSDLHTKEIAAMSPSRRMSLGRDIEAQRVAVEAAKPKRQMTAEEEAQALIMLRGISHPATRLAAAREIGLA
jgi:hypothetical protein